MSAFTNTNRLSWVTDLENVVKSKASTTLDQVLGKHEDTLGDRPAFRDALTCQVANNASKAAWVFSKPGDVPPTRAECTVIFDPSSDGDRFRLGSSIFDGKDNKIIHAFSQYYSLKNDQYDVRPAYKQDNNFNPSGHSQGSDARRIELPPAATSASNLTPETLSNAITDTFSEHVTTYGFHGCLAHSAKASMEVVDDLKSGVLPVLQAKVRDGQAIGDIYYNTESDFVPTRSDMPLRGLVKIGSDVTKSRWIDSIKGGTTTHQTLDEIPTENWLRLRLSLPDAETSSATG